jgi:hypothetical protein
LRMSQPLRDKVLTVGRQRQLARGCAGRSALVIAIALDSLGKEREGSALAKA